MKNDISESSGSRAVTSPAERAESKLRVNMRLSVVEGLFAMPICFLATPGNFLMASLTTEAIGLKAAVYGVIASLPAWSNVIQLFALPWINRHASMKTVCLTFSWLHILAWAVVGLLLPRIAAEGPWHSAWLAILLFGLGSIAFALVNVTWTSWVQEWLPSRSRGKYLGRRNRLLQISMVAFLLLAWCLLGIWKEDVIFGFQVVIFGSVALRAVSIVLQQWILPVKVVADERRGSPLVQFGVVMRNKPLLRFIGFGAAFGFTANIVGPFFPVYFYQALGMSVDEVAKLAIIATITGALSMPAWGAIVDKHGCRPSLVMALGIWMIVGYGYLFATPERTWVLFVIWAIGGAAGAGFLFGTFNMILKLIPAEAKTTAISFNLAATSLSAAIAPILGGLIFKWCKDAFPDQLAVFHVVSVLHHTATLATDLILVGVVEPKASTLTQAIGAMRSLRQVGALLGVSFLVNYSFFKRDSGKREKRLVD